MTIRPLTRAEARSIDEAAEAIGLPTLVLMENAGRGAAERLRTRLRPGDAVAVACGPGNNGGDGAVLARHLDAWGHDVRVAWFADPARLRGDAATQYGILAKSGIRQAAIAEPGDFAPLWSGAAWIVDALLGTGLTRPVEGLLRSAIEAINGSGRPVLALDLPSGLDADSGVPLGLSVRATLTVTFVAGKVGFQNPESATCTGEVDVAEIGVPASILRPFL